jgi:hypothetical protein
LAYEPGEDPLPLETYLAIKENVMCLRLVEIETNDHFELLFVHAKSNIDAIQLAAMTRPGATGMWARPVGDR